jgi:predicted Zn-dependent protease
VQANPEKHLWAESYDRDLRNVLDMQSEIARTVADQIKITVTPAERLRLNVVQPVDPEAHELLLKGNFYFEKWNEAGFKKAVEYFNQSVQKEPQNARAYAGLAIAYAGIGISDPSAYSKEEAAALQALKIDDNLGEAHNALAWAKFTLDWDTVAADREFRRAIELNPNDARAHSWYGIFLAMLGRIEDSWREVRRTRELDPLSFAKTSLAWRTYYNARDYDKGIQLLQNVAEMEPTFLATYYHLTLFYEQKSEFDKAIQVREDGAKFDKEHAKELTLQALLLRKAYAATGARGYWNQELQFLKTQKTNNVKGGACCDDAIGLVYTRLGRKEEAIRSLEEAFNNHLPYLIWELPAGPDLDPLRSDPRFADLLARLLHRSE